MKYDRETLQKGLENALVRAYILRDFSLPLKGYSLIDLVGNQSVDLSFEYKDREKYLSAIGMDEGTITFPVYGPGIDQGNLVLFRIYDDLELQDIYYCNFIEGSKLFLALGQILAQEIDYQGDTGYLKTPLVFSFGITVSESCGTSIPKTSSTVMTEPTDDPLPLTGVMGETSIGLQIGISNYQNNAYPSIRILGILADPNIDMEEKKKILLNDFNVDIDRNICEDYDFLSRIEHEKEN